MANIIIKDLGLILIVGLAYTCGIYSGKLSEAAPIEITTVVTKIVEVEKEVLVPRRLDGRVHIYKHDNELCPCGTLGHVHYE